MPYVPGRRGADPCADLHAPPPSALLGTPIPCHTKHSKAEVPAPPASTLPPPPLVEQTVLDPEWEKATLASFAAFPRHASEVPVVMNPGRSF